MTSGCHQEAWRFAPREPDASDCFNWIPLCRDEHMAHLLAAAVVQPEADPHEQQFWKLADLQLCAALFAHVAQLSVPTPATLARLLDLDPTQLIACPAHSPVPRARSMAAMLGELKAETWAGIVLSVANKLSFLRYPEVRRFTSATLQPPDFRSLTERPIAICWVLHEQDVAATWGAEAGAAITLGATAGTRRGGSIGDVEEGLMAGRPREMPNPDHPGSRLEGETVSARRLALPGRSCRKHRQWHTQLRSHGYSRQALDSHRGSSSGVPPGSSRERLPHQRKRPDGPGGTRGNR